MYYKCMKCITFFLFWRGEGGQAFEENKLTVLNFLKRAFMTESVG